MSEGKWRYRIVREGFEEPEQLLANPFNARIHNALQEQALVGVLDEIGWIDKVQVNLTTGHVVDGHLRVSAAIRNGESRVPVEYLDLTEGEERLVLLSKDWITQMAGYDTLLTQTLIEQVDSENAALQTMIDSMGEVLGISFPDTAMWDEVFDGVPDTDRAPFQQMTFTLHDTQVEIVKRALEKAKQSKIAPSVNENSNGNALALICEAYLNG